ncbi:hypothetical protein DY000_02011466 [Brassica cretica]|uniref:Serine/threonine-protein kinase n=1 Tax=Brassica cretica TaxID=69181 RepID=A0ABQ7DBE4_BRACR|nr:hypothetical protein DY000_02011466 [Brassica cretica]
MSSLISQQWQERTSGFFSSSGTKLREARQSAGSFVGEVAKDAKVNVADVAERVGSLFKSRWAILQQPATRHAVQEHLITAAATTGTLVRKGITETKEKVSVGKIKVEEAAKKTAQKSKTLLTDIERWQKGVASSDVFGVAIEITVQRQESSRPIPFILMKCADYLILTGLNSPNLFKAEGDKKLIQQLVSAYNQDPSASIPEGVNPVDVAALMKYYLASLPTPLTTFELYNEIKDARSSVTRMRKSLQKLSSVNYNTLEFITALLLRVSQKAQLNKMDSHSLAMEMAPVIMWREEKRPESYREYWRRPSRSPKKSIDFETASPWDLLSDEGEGVVDASSSISLDDIVQVDFGAVDVVQCLIEHHNAIFTDAGETFLDQKQKKISYHFDLDNAYGTVYKCNLHHTTGAVKVLHAGETQLSKQFDQELEILSKIRHPHLVLLLGACPERGCLVYEYMDNGSLDDRLMLVNDTPPIPWFERFRIALEVASALVFLHKSKPRPIIHRDLKPGNILLNQNFVSKLGDVGLSTMVNQDDAASKITVLKKTSPVGTLCYIDPEYQRTGLISPKSDVYSLGVVILQLITAKPAIGITHIVEEAIGDDVEFMGLLDVKAGAWPISETRELAALGLRCTEMRRRDRPDLKDEIIPALERLRKVVDKYQNSLSRTPSGPPSHFICPLLKGVMNQPCLASDGYTYDREAIEDWLREKDTSPVTNLPLPNKNLLANYSLYSAIMEWKKSNKL